MSKPQKNNLEQFGEQKIGGRFFQSIKDFFQRLYLVGLVLYFGGIVTAAITLSFVFPFLAPAIIATALAAIVVSVVVLAAIRAAGNAIVGLFNKPKPEITTISYKHNSTPQVSTTATLTTALSQSSSSSSSSSRLELTSSRDKVLVVPKRSVTWHSSVFNKHSVERAPAVLAQEQADTASVSARVAA